jgi:hypothetical protein
LTTFFFRSSDVDTGISGNTGKCCYVLAPRPRVNKDGKRTLFIEEVLGLRFTGEDPFADFMAGIRGDPGGICAGPPTKLAVRLLVEAFDVTDSASEPLRPFDLLFAI